MTHGIWEARALREITEKTGVKTQMGNQAHANDHMRRCVELIRAGVIGKVKEIHAWTNRPIWPQAPEWVQRPTTKNRVPDGLNWDAFIGPSEERPYHPIYQPYKWRGWRAFGTGALGDTGVHILNLPLMGCGLSDPKSVKCLLSGPINEETFPAWATVKFEFQKGNNAAQVPLFWYEGKIGHLSKDFAGKENLPPPDLFLGENPVPNGCLIRGSKGTMYVPSIFGTRWKVYSGTKWTLPEELNCPVGYLPRNGRGDSGMKDELVRAIRTGNQELSLANFNYASKLNELIMLGNIALLSGGQFRWNSASCISDRQDVNNLLSKPYRKGWEVNSA